VRGLLGGLGLVPAVLRLPPPGKGVAKPGQVQYQGEQREGVIVAVPARSYRTVRLELFGGRLRPAGGRYYRCSAFLIGARSGRSSTRSARWPAATRCWRLGVAQRRRHLGGRAERVPPQHHQPEQTAHEPGRARDAADTRDPHLRATMLLAHRQALLATQVNGRSQR